MRILYVSHSFPLPDQPLSNVGGMQRVAVALYKTLAARHDVEVIPVLLESSWKWTDARTPGFLFGLLLDLPRLVRQHRADVVLFSSMVTASVTALIGERIRGAGAITAAIPVGRDVTLPNPIYQRLVPRVLGALDLIFPISHATADACMSRGADRRKVYVVPCGVDPPRDGARDRTGGRNAVRSLLRTQGHELPDESLVLLSVGRHQERKGFHWFVEEVMPRLAEDVIYLIAGSGPMTAKITDRIEAGGLADRVILLGQVTEEVLGSLYSGSDLFVMPNIPVPGDIEGFGVVMLEAGAAGLPVVAANLEGIRDVVTDGTNGRLVPSRDAAGFAFAIDRYRDRSVLATASLRAREHVDANFGWPTVAENLLQILRKRVRTVSETG